MITGSGLSKGELTADDMVTVTVADSRPVSGTRRPSAETAIHTAIYRATNAERWSTCIHRTRPPKQSVRHRR